DKTPATVNYINVFPEDQTEYFKQDSPTGPLRPLQFDVSKYLCDMVHTPIPRSDGTSYVFPPAARILSNGKLASFASGLETSDAVVDAGGNTVAKGRVEISYQMADIHLRKYTTLATAYDGCPFKSENHR